MSYKILSHLNTSNNYVRRSNLVKNIASIEKYIKTDDFKKLVYPHKSDVLEELKKQHTFLKNVNKTIAMNEQISFAFGGFASPN